MIGNDNQENYGNVNESIPSVVSENTETIQSNPEVIDCDVHGSVTLDVEVTQPRVTRSGRTVRPPMRYGRDYGVETRSKR